jgi:uncharacterized membrane protein
MSDLDDREPDDRMRERASGSTLRTWLLLGADRGLVAGLILLLVLLLVVGAGLAHPTPARTLLTRGDPVETLYQALVSSTITGVTLVLTLSQLVLSGEFGGVGDQRERMDSAVEFRSDVASLVGEDVSPVEPSAFLRALVAATRERAAALDDALSDPPEAVAAYLDTVRGNADAVTERLDGARFGEFDVVRAVLDYNYSWKLYAGRRIRAEQIDGLDEEASQTLSELVSTLELFGPAREYFKTLYFRWELSDLSRTLLVVAVPALAVAVASLAFFDPRDVTGATLGVPNVLLVLGVTTVVSVSPFAVLLSYVLRIVTVTKRTLSVGPFVLRDTDRSAGFDLDALGEGGEGDGVDEVDGSEESDG